MGTSLNIILPFFILVGMGYLAARLNIITKAAVGGLNGFVFYFTLPALLYLSMSAKPLEELINLPYMAGYGLAGIVLFILSALIARLVFKAPLGVMSLMGQGAVVGNVGFLGIPLITGLMGPDAAVPVGVALVVDLLVMVPFSIILLEVAAAGNTKPFAVAKDALKAAILNPFVISMVLGILGAAGQWDLPDMADNLLAMLAAATAPTALFAIGASLYGHHISEKMAETAFLSFAKLVIHPLAVWVALFVIIPVDPYWATAAVLTAAMPVAGNLFIIAQRFNLYVTRCSTAIMVSTAFAAILFPLIVAYSGLMKGMLAQ